MPPACASASTISVAGIAGFSRPTCAKNGSSTETCFRQRTHSPASPPATVSTSTNGNRCGRCRNTSWMSVGGIAGIVGGFARPLYHATLRGAAIIGGSRLVSPIRHEGPRSGQARRRLQRQGPRQAGRLGRGHRERQDVDEPVRRDRGRGGGAAAREGRGDRGRRGV